MRKFNSFFVIGCLFCCRLRAAKGAFSLVPELPKGKHTVIYADGELFATLQPAIFYLSLVKIGNFHLTLLVKIGYNVFMFGSIVSFVLRIWLVVAFWAFIWQFVQPRTQLMRILRAALLMLGLLGILTTLRITGR